MAKPDINIAEELGVVLEGESLERVIDLLAEPDGFHCAGRLARLGAAFSRVGKDLTEAAKEQMVAIPHHIEDGVLFKWREPTSQVRVDTVAIKRMLPAEEFPDYYREFPVKGSVSIELPFR